MNCLIFLMEIGVNITMMYLSWSFLWREGFGDHRDKTLFFFSFHPFKCFSVNFWLGAPIFAYCLDIETILGQ